jgi:hypothetical protein
MMFLVSISTLTLFIIEINVREYRRGNQKWIIQRNWQQGPMSEGAEPKQDSQNRSSMSEGAEPKQDSQNRSPMSEGAEPKQDSQNMSRFCSLRHR